MEFKNIIELWPHYKELAEDIQVKPDVVRKWRYRNKIPSRYWARLITAAQKRGHQVTLGQLADLSHAA